MPSPSLSSVPDTLPKQRLLELGRFFGVGLMEPWVAAALRVISNAPGGLRFLRFGVNSRHRESWQTRLCVHLGLHGSASTGNLKRSPRHWSDVSLGGDAAAPGRDEFQLEVRAHVVGRTA